MNGDWLPKQKSKSKRTREEQLTPAPLPPPELLLDEPYFEEQSMKPRTSIPLQNNPVKQLVFVLSWICLLMLTWSGLILSRLVFHEKGYLLTLALLLHPPNAKKKDKKKTCHQKYGVGTDMSRQSRRLDEIRQHMTRQDKVR